MVCERYMQEQMDDYFANLLCKFQCGFWQVFSAQQCLLDLTEKPTKKIFCVSYKICCHTLQKNKIGSVFSDFLIILHGVHRVNKYILEITKS